MAITITAPTMESWLQKEAAKRGLTPAEYARQLLELHQPVPPLAHHGQQEQEQQEQEQQEHEQAAHGSEVADSWTQAFNTWVDSHARRAPLPPEAFARASFYAEPV